MIEINLLEQKKPFKMPVVLGVDLATINYKLLLLAIVINYVPDMLIYPKWEEGVTEINQEIEALNANYAKLQAEVKGNESVKKQLEAFNGQVSKLKERSEQVDKIIKQRTNPNKLYERIARNIPDDMWLTDITVQPDKKIAINGMSTSYKSIGNFIILLNESLFFGKSLTLADSKTENDPDSKLGKRVEVFSIQGMIESFDPQQQ